MAEAVNGLSNTLKLKIKNKWRASCSLSWLATAPLSGLLMMQDHSNRIGTGDREI
jgi:hypothetical protein